MCVDSISRVVSTEEFEAGLAKTGVNIKKALTETFNRYAHFVIELL